MARSATPPSAPPPAASAAPPLTAPDVIVVPDVVGLTVAAASAQLAAAHLTWAVVEVDGPAPAGVVLSTTIATDGTVTLRVSRGSLRAVPQLVQATPPYSLAIAKAVLTTAGFAGPPVVAYVPVTDPALDGKVVQQDPHAGTLADPATTAVTLGVGAYPRQRRDLPPIMITACGRVGRRWQRSGQRQRALWSGRLAAMDLYSEAARLRGTLWGAPGSGRRVRWGGAGRAGGSAARAACPSAPGAATSRRPC